MSEHKTVVIDIEETEKAQLDEHSGLSEIEVSGVLSVKNVSEKSRIWNVRVLLGDTRDRTNIGEETIPAGEVDAGGRWDTTYDVSAKAPILTLTEVFDTCEEVKTEEPHWAYAFGKDNPVKMTITLKNETDGQIDNIVLNKTIPSELTEITIDEVTSGTAEFDEGTGVVVWKDFVIYPQEESTVVIKASGRVKDVDAKGAGEMVVTYRGEEQTRSVLAPDMTALTEFLAGIESAETEPNSWECTLECSNESDLVVRLDKAEVYLEPEDGGDKEKMIDEAPAVELAPNDEWRSSFEVTSKSPPKCTQEIIYTPTNVVTKRVLGTIDKTPQLVPVYRIEYSKTFDPPKVASFDKTPVEVTIEVTNAGSAKLNEVQVLDNLPDDIMPPTSEYVEVFVRGDKYDGEMEIAIDPDDQDPDSPHTLSVKLSNLKDSVGELEPDETMRINYSIMTWKSRPEKEYPSPIRCLANTYPPGLEAEIASDEDGHKIGVVYKKRRISAKKGINKGSETGEYIVQLVIENKGEVTVENVRVTDWIPEDFEFVSVEPEDLEPSQAAADGGTNLGWIFERMNPEDKKKIRVTVRGEGEYERREPEVISD
ncbi:MAG: DUF11 domain-containing protein [Candidatus Thorarchaeota archaeon]|nr:MAG: DUF11 domain-containing protein [Candidatus Thorarchaeota archaeon]